jgi:ATP-binding cassette subfamily B (MDR/TAP) protein 1
MRYNTPKINVVVGAFFQTLNGLIGPLMGVLITKALFAMILYVGDMEKMRTEVNIWVLWMFIGALAAFVLNIIGKWMFGIVGENITLNVRKDLYESIIRKHVGWHDD